MPKKKPQAVRDEESAEVVVPVDGRVLLVKTADGGELRVTIPKDGKVTFGPAIPGPRAAQSYGPPQMEYALRIYQGTKDNLLGIFTNVREFRDITMPVAKLLIREAGKSVWKSDEDGYSVQQDVKRTKHLVPDVNLLNAAPADEESGPF